MNEYIIILFSIIGTSVAYIIGRWIYQRLYFPFFIPIVVASVFIIIFLISFNISYDTYMLGGNLISKLLGPAVVALAYPLYSQRALLKRLAIPIVVGTFVGAIIGIVTGVLFAKWLHFDKEIIYSLSPKSVTTPIAMEVAKSLGGHMSLAAVFVIIAGIAGAVLHRYIFKLFRLKSKVSRGVGMGSGSHAIGTAKALENSEVEGSASTVAMILSMIFVSLLTPVLVGLIL